MTDLQAQLKKIRTLEAEVLGQLATQTDDDKIEALEKAQPMVKPGSKEHEALLATGYGFDKKQAETIIKERAERPELWPYAMKEKAEAFLAALKAKPVVISTRKAWRIRGNSRVTRTV